MILSYFLLSVLVTPYNFPLSCDTSVIKFCIFYVYNHISGWPVSQESMKSSISRLVIYIWFHSFYLSYESVTFHSSMERNERIYTTF